MSKKGLGRGLSALFGDDDAGPEKNGATQTSTTSRTVPISQLEPCAFQPRRHFDAPSIAELADSLKAHGVLQPLLVRPHPTKTGVFEIVAGERRWRAAQKAKIHELPVVVRTLSDRDVLEIGLIENLQRENLQPLEEAETYKRLIDEHAYTQEDLGRIIGKSRSHIANMMRLMTLPDTIKSYLMTGKITAGHARALIGAPQAESLAERIVREGLSVRDTERLATDAPPTPVTKGTAKLSSVNIDAMENQIANILGWRVRVDAKRDGSGKIVIPYKTLDQFEEILLRMGLNQNKKR